MVVPQKLLKGQHNMSDRISNLPDSLIHHILSFVDTRDAAQASVFSKRWNYIWRSIPTLQFRCQDSSQVNKFIDFIDRTLELHDESNIQKFSLYSDVHLNESQIGKWISIVISHNVEVLSLELNQRDPVLVPSSLYTCESLIHLRLTSMPKICFPKYISFPRLQRLTLADVEFRDECWNEELFSHCPVLEFLYMINCTWSDMKNFCISNHTLKDLIIYNTEEEEEGFRNCNLKIHAPNLKNLGYISRVPKDYVLTSFPTLVKALIDFSFEEYGELIDYGKVVSKFLRALAPVVYLAISDGTLQVLSVADDILNNLPSYLNLYELCLTEKVTADEALIAFLGKLPNLVLLKFQGFASPFPDNDDEEEGDQDIGVDGGEYNHYNEVAEGESDNDSCDNGWALDTVDARCSLLHLKLVSFNKFTGNAREMRWLKLILKNAKALETMTISCDAISYMKSENVMANISSLPRASASCVFNFLSEQG